MGENRRRRKQQAEMIQIAARMAEMLARLKKTPYIQNSSASNETSMGGLLGAAEG